MLDMKRSTHNFVYVSVIHSQEGVQVAYVGTDTKEGMKVIGKAWETSGSFIAGYKETWVDGELRYMHKAAHFQEGWLPGMDSLNAAEKEAYHELCKGLDWRVENKVGGAAA
ncbi:hypothetical protein ACTFR8_23960 [Bacillus cereus group sp. MYBK15-3]|uniref:hypothetical protein n=1 Tax=Bacillus cereus group TaxID=86661 RepID=UPI001C8BCBCA|nr:hypothetical protein [Bacillus cereus]MBX9158655.1 hypothetical protein [Bacillus cereus]